MLNQAFDWCGGRKRRRTFFYFWRLYMKKERKRIPKRLLSFVLSVVLLSGLLPASVFAASDRTAPAEYTVAAYGGTIAYADSEETFRKIAPADNYSIFIPNRVRKIIPSICMVFYKFHVFL